MVKDYQVDNFPIRFGRLRRTPVSCTWQWHCIYILVYTLFKFRTILEHFDGKRIVQKTREGGIPRVNFPDNYTRSIPEVYQKYTGKVNYRSLPICDNQDELANVVIYKQTYYMLYPVQRPKVCSKCVHKQQE